jgi:hypothetical protein
MPGVLRFSPDLGAFFDAQGVRCTTTPTLPKGLLRPLLDTPSLGAGQVLNLPSTTQSYRRLIPRQKRRMTSPLQHLPMSEQPAVRPQIKRASKLPRYPHGHVMETTSSRPTVRRLDAVSVSPLNYSQVRFLLSLHSSIIGFSCPLNDMKFYGENSFGDRTAHFEFKHVPLLLH